MSIRLRWLGTACFEICLPDGETLIIDPYMDESITCPIRSEQVERADLICISHGHFDHILDVGRLANRLGSEIICSREVAENIERRFGIGPRQIRAVTAGEVLRRGPIQLEIVKAIHIDNRVYFAQQLGIEPSEAISTEDMVRRVFNSIRDQGAKEKLLAHMGKYPAGEQLNYIFRFPGNLRLYFFGSVPSPELFTIAEESQAQILVLQILRGMEEGAVEVAMRSGATVVFPSHHDPFFPGQKVADIRKVCSLFESKRNVRLIEIEAGKWCEIDLIVKL